MNQPQQWLKHLSVCVRRHVHAAARPTPCWLVPSQRGVLRLHADLDEQGDAAADFAGKDEEPRDLPRLILRYSSFSCIAPAADVHVPGSLCSLGGQPPYLLAITHVVLVAHVLVRTPSFVLVVALSLGELLMKGVETAL